MTSRLERAQAFLAGPRARVTAVVASILVALPWVFSGFALDDLWQRIYLTRAARFAPAVLPPLELFTFYDGAPARGRWLMDQGISQWWTSPHLRIAFLRPLSAVTHWLDYALWPDAPALMHLHSIAWYALGVAIAASLYRRLLGAGWVAGFAALIYAVDHTHALAATWIANRNGAIAAALGLASLWLHDRARRDGSRAACVASPLVLGLAVLSAEAALGVLGFFAAYALFVDPARARRGALALAPHALVVAAWLAVYELGHYGAHGSGMYVDPVASPGTLARFVAVGYPLLFATELGAPTPDVYPMAPLGVRVALIVVAVLFIALAAAALLPLVRRNAVARFLLVGAAIGVVPACLTVPSSRTLLLPGFGFIGLVALAVEAAVERTDTRRALVAFAAWAGGGHLLLSPLVFQVGAGEIQLLSGKFAAIADRLPDDRDLARQRLVIVNAPDGAFTGYVSVMRWAQGRVVPRELLSLAVGTRDVDLDRTGPGSVVVRSAGGFIKGGTELLTRDPREKMPVGTRVVLDGVTVDVVDVTVDGRPARVRFGFDRPLEDPSLRWVAWRGQRLVPFALPPVGGSAHLAAQSLLP